VKTIILLGLLMWVAAACSDAAEPTGAWPDAGSEPRVTSSRERWREPVGPFHGGRDATVSSCESSRGPCGPDGLPPPQGPGDPIEPDRPNGPAPDPSPIDTPSR